MIPQGSGGFNPNDPLYRTCCCHTKTFTIVTGILEIFTICFILVAIIPDINSRICTKKIDHEGMLNVTDLRNSTGLPTTTTPIPTTMDTNETEDYKEHMNGFRHFMCEMNVGWLVCAICDIVAVNIMFYAIKSVRWLLFIPHVVFRCLIIALFILGIVLEVYAIVEGGANPSSTAVGICFTAIGGIFFVFILIAEIKCAHFIKRSQETGYSISVARPIGPQTISMSEREQHAVNNTQARAALPPLRHTYGNAAQKYAE